jgi:thiamine-phosphate pyrophosphorylase
MGRLDARSLGVYVVTSSGLVAGRGHREVALAAIEGGATAVQLRAKEPSDEELRPLASELAARCREAGVLFVVNDRVEVALESGAAAVHVGQSDGLGGVRERIGPEMVLGISVDGPAQARAAEASGADYLGVTVWSTPTKPEAVPRGPDGVGVVVRATSLPVVGIGGIDASNAAEVLAAGAAGVAVVSAIGAARDPVAATRALAQVVTGWMSDAR